jgi:hypothetical protein
VPPDQLAVLWAQAGPSPVEACPTPAEALERARGAPPRASRDLAHISTLVDPPGAGVVLERDPAA